jgi:8-oxo-dGTP pyrophosphatase MutT (NUDIX family)
VLVPVFRDAGGRLRIVLIVRTDRGLHAGQIALPGGQADETDDSLLATALREAEEEVGLDPAHVEILAEIAPVQLTVSNFRVHAYLGSVPPDVRWRANADEVVEVLTPAVDELWDPAARRELLVRPARFPEGLLVDAIPLGERVLWGMTLRLLDDVVPRLLAGEWDI